MTDPAILISAYILDLVIGDPQWLPHPVRFMGLGIDRMERALRNANTRKHESAEVKGNALMERASGFLLVAVVVSITYAMFYALSLLVLNSHLSLLLSSVLFAVLVFLTSTTFATNDLIRSGKAVIDALDMGKKEEAREKLGMIVGRDTKRMDIKEISKATIETLSENASDGIIAPMFYFAVGGLPLAMTYKAVNTLDSMIGYRNEKYKDFGWAAARLDDIANYIPARITGMLIFVATSILHSADRIREAFRIGTVNGSNALSGLNSLKVMLRDGRNHLSPNSGIPEAAMAGALGVRLGGPSTYGGILVEKPYIGDEKSGVAGQGPGVNEMYLHASGKAISLVKITSVLGLGLALILLYLRTVLW